MRPVPRRIYETARYCLHPSVYRPARCRRVASPIVAVPVRTPQARLGLAPHLYSSARRCGASVLAAAPGREAATPPPIRQYLGEIAPSHCRPQAQGCADLLWDVAITAGNYDRRNGVRLSFFAATILRTECPLWVKSGHYAVQ